MKSLYRKIIPTNNWRILSVILLFALLDASLFAQEEVFAVDSTGNEVVISNGGTKNDTLSSARSDTVKNDEDMLEHSPRKAMIYSMILPGLGQAYNNKYFKIPIVYGVLGTVGYWISYNTEGYRFYVDEYEQDQSRENETFLRAWRRNLELSYITLAGAYALQVLDAYVDAHLFYWDVNPDLTLRIEPSVETSSMPIHLPVNYYGLSCKFTF
ncbi:MAG: hypothetical protein K9J30_00995 [Bacteroidales bacterium]|nr:hypothetical protein [Bacteroidales bacterium]